MFAKLINKKHLNKIGFKLKFLHIFDTKYEAKVNFHFRLLSVVYQMVGKDLQGYIINGSQVRVDVLATVFQLACVNIDENGLSKKIWQIGFYKIMEPL